MWTPVPWAVGGGALITVDLGRLLAYASTSGAEGIVNPTDLKVQALATPGTSIRVAPGSALIRNRYANARSQTYVADNPVQHTVPIRQTTSGAARTDLVVARVYDPQFGGQNEPKPGAGEAQSFQYVRTEVIEGVPANVDHAYVRNLGYPAIPLARIAIPASTATITDAMITDMRVVANPRSVRYLRTIYGTGIKAESGHQTNPNNYASWPIRNDQLPSFWVPEWATRLDVVAHFSGVYYQAGGDTEDTVAGIRTGFGAEGAENGIIVADFEDNNGRYHYSLVGNHSISPARRGSTQFLNLQARRTSGRGSWFSDYQTSIAVDVEFTEAPD